MMQLLNYFFKNRLSWLILALTALILELITLYLQYVRLVHPCVLCIYERCALCGIFFAGLIGAIAPKTLIRFAGITVWLYSSLQGLILSIKHINIQLYSYPFITCNFFVNFPTWLPLDKWIPSIFSADSDCVLYQWHFLSLETPQLTIIIFSSYLFAALVILLAQFFFNKRP